MVKKFETSLNKYLSDVMLMYVKLHNLHWNVVGINFKAAHEYIEELYDSFNEMYDEIAELLKMKDLVPLSTMKDYLATSSIEEIANKDYSVAEAISIIIEDFNFMKAEAEAIRKEADEEDLYDIVGMLEDNLGFYNKALWFMKSMVK